MENHYEYFADFKVKIKQEINKLLEYPEDNNKFSKNSFQRFRDAVETKLRPLKSKEIKRVGKTISWETIRDIVNYDFEDKLKKMPLDPKVEKTLSRLCIYLGVINWEGFINNTKRGLTKDKVLIEEIKESINAAISVALTVLNSQKKNPLAILKNYFTLEMANSIFESLSYNKKREAIVQNKNFTFYCSNFQIVDISPVRAEILVYEFREESIKGEVSGLIEAKELKDLNIPEYFEREEILNSGNDADKLRIALLTTIINNKVKALSKEYDYYKIVPAQNILRKRVHDTCVYTMLKTGSKWKVDKRRICVKENNITPIPSDYSEYPYVFEDTVRVDSSSEFDSFYEGYLEQFENAKRNGEIPDHTKPYSKGG